MLHTSTSNQKNISPRCRVSNETKSENTKIRSSITIQRFNHKAKYISRSYFTNDRLLSLGSKSDPDIHDAISDTSISPMTLEQRSSLFQFYTQFKDHFTRKNKVEYLIDHNWDYIWEIIGVATPYFCDKRRLQYFHKASNEKVCDLEDKAGILSDHPQFSEILKIINFYGFTSASSKVNILSELDRHGYNRVKRPDVNCKFEKQYSSNRSKKNFAHSLVSTALTCNELEFANEVYLQYIVDEFEREGRVVSSLIKEWKGRILLSDSGPFALTEDEENKRCEMIDNSDGICEKCDDSDDGCDLDHSCHGSCEHAQKQKPADCCQESSHSDENPEEPVSSLDPLGPLPFVSSFDPIPIVPPTSNTSPTTLDSSSPSFISETSDSVSKITEDDYDLVALLLPPPPCGFEYWEQFIIYILDILLKDISLNQLAHKNCFYHFPHHEKIVRCLSKAETIFLFHNTDLGTIINAPFDSYCWNLLRESIGEELLAKSYECNSSKEGSGCKLDIENSLLRKWFEIDRHFLVNAMIKSYVDCKINCAQLRNLMCQRLCSCSRLRHELKRHGIKTAICKCSCN